MQMKLRLEDLPEVKPHLITKLNRAGIESVFDLAIAIPHEAYRKRWHTKILKY